jgi:hypothetical protein
MPKFTFDHLLKSRQARRFADRFLFDKHGLVGTHWMDEMGDIHPIGILPSSVGLQVIWQGYLSEGSPPQEPMVFKSAFYFNVYSSGFAGATWSTRKEADYANNNARDRIACKRFELEAIQGQYDD